MFELSLTNLPPAPGTYNLILGVSNRSWSGVPLPIGMAIIGMPGCNLLVSGELFVPPTIHPGGAANIAITVPANAALIGASVFVQAMISDPLSENPVGATMTNGAVFVVGSR